MLLISATIPDFEESEVIPIDFVGNVTQLHENLFGETSYQPSEKVQQIHDDIIYLSGVTEDTNAMESTFEGDIHDEGTQSE